MLLGQISDIHMCTRHRSAPLLNIRWYFEEAVGEEGAVVEIARDDLFGFKLRRWFLAVNKHDDRQVVGWLTLNLLETDSNTMNTTQRHQVCFVPRFCRPNVGKMLVGVGAIGHVNSQCHPLISTNSIEPS